MKILGIGQSVIDHISVESAGGGVVSNHVDAGGPALVALMLLARLGEECTFLTTLGNDRGGKYVRDLMSSENITMDVRNHAHTKINIIRVDAQTGHREKNQSTIEHPHIAGLEPAFLRGFDMIIMDRHEPVAFYEVVRHKRPDTTLVIDPSTELSDFTLDMMRAADCPIVTIETLAQLGSGYTLVEASRKLSELCGSPLVVTLGQHGSLIYDGKSTRIIPAFDVSVVNDLGAGDVYRAGFAYGQIQGWALDKCMLYGSAAAAHQCTRPGNAADVSTQNDIAKILQSSQHRLTDSAALDATFEKLQSQLAPLATVN